MTPANPHSTAREDGPCCICSWPGWSAVGRDGYIGTRGPFVLRCYLDEPGRPGWVWKVLYKSDIQLDAGLVEDEARAKHAAFKVLQAFSVAIMAPDTPTGPICRMQPSARA